MDRIRTSGKSSKKGDNGHATYALDDYNKMKHVYAC